MKRVMFFVCLLMPLCSFGGIQVNKETKSLGFNDVPWVKYAVLNTNGGDSAKADSSFSMKDSMSNNICMSTYAYVYAKGYSQATASAEAGVTKTGFCVKPPFVFRIYVGGDMYVYENGYSLAGNGDNIILCLNGIWETIWSYSAYNDQVVGNICDTITKGTVTGVKINCLSSATLYQSGPHEADASSHLGFDTVAVEPIGIEESSKLEIQNAKMEITQNPFGQNTVIRYSLSDYTNIRLTIYDLSGRCVKTLVNGEKTSGSYNINLNAKELSSGIYFVKFSSGNYKETKKLILIK